MYNVSLGGQPCLDPAEERSNLLRLGRSVPAELDRCNSLWNPLGREPARGWLLLKRQSLSRLDLNALLTLVMDDGTKKLTINNLVVSKEPLGLDTGQTANAADNSFLVEVSDTRWRCSNPYFSIAANKQYNVRAPAWGGAAGGNIYYASSTNGGTAWTWLGMVQDLWGLLSTQLGTAPSSIPATVDGVPEGWVFAGVPAWDALCQVLDRLGCAVSWSPLTGAYSVVQVGAADTVAANLQTQLQSQALRTGDAEYQSVIRGRVPYGVRVAFHRHELYAGTERGTDQTSAQWQTSAVYTVDVAGPYTASAEPGTYHLLWDDLPALYDGTGALTNAAALATRAANRAADFFRMLAGVGGTRLHKTYAGLQQVQTGSTVKLTVWRQVPAGEGEPARFETDIVCHPYPSVRITDEGRYLPCCTGKDSTPIQPFAFGPGLPNWPPLIQVLRIANGTPAGALYDSALQHSNADTTWADAESVYGVDLAGAASLTADDKYLCRLIGFTSSRPLYAFRSSQGAGSVGPQGPPGSFLFLEPEQGEEGMPIPGPPGQPGTQGLQGLQGVPGVALLLDGEEGPEGLPVPGPVGPQGATGLQGLPGVTFLLDGDQGEEGMPVPGPVGPTGSQGIQGLPGPTVWLEPDPGEDGMPIPGSLTGTGTTNRIPKWLYPTGIGDSSIKDDGTLVTFLLVPTSPGPGSGANDEIWGSGSGAALTTGYSNTALGKPALASATTGYRNVAIGDHSLATLDTGFDNMALGSYAMFSATSARDNAAVGYSALYFTTSGYDNLALGTQAAYHNTTGNGNVAIGSQALFSGLANTNSVALGSGALYLADATGNIGIGLNSLQNLAAGWSYNTGIGISTGQTLTGGQYNLLLGANADTAASNTNHGVALGDSAVCASNECAFGPSLNVQTGYGTSSIQTRPRADLTDSWVSSTDASRKARRVLNVWDTAAREVLRGEATGTAAALGVLGAAAIPAQSGDLGTAMQAFGFMSSFTYTLTSGEVTAALGFTPFGGTDPLPLLHGGTAANLSGTGGANQFVKQSSAGAAFTVGTIGGADITAALDALGGLTVTI